MGITISDAIIGFLIAMIISFSSSSENKYIFSIQRMFFWNDFLSFCLNIDSFFIVSFFSISFDGCSHERSILRLFILLMMNVIEISRSNVDDVSIIPASMSSRYGVVSAFQLYSVSMKSSGNISQNGEEYTMISPVYVPFFELLGAMALSSGYCISPLSKTNISFVTNLFISPFPKMIPFTGITPGFITGSVLMNDFLPGGILPKFMVASSLCVFIPTDAVTESYANKCIISRNSMYAARNAVIVFLRFSGFDPRM